MKEVIFQPNGERLSIDIQFGQAQIGSYRLRLWESGSNTTLLDQSGNNKNPDDDSYDLPLPTDKNDGRLVQVETSIVSPTATPGEQYSVTIIFKQGTKEIEKVVDKGPITNKRVTPEFWITLKKM
jgi:hypothetical protein